MVSRRSRPGSSSTTRMRALRLVECGVASCMAACIQKPLRFPSFGLWGPSVVRRAFDVRDRIQLGLRIGERLLETGIFLALGGRATRQLSDAVVRGAVVRH